METEAVAPGVATLWGERKVVGLGLAVASLGHLAMGLFLPSMPKIEQALSAPEGLVQRSLSAYMLGVGLSQMLYGTWSDRWGRRPVIVAGLWLSALSALAGSRVEGVESLIAVQFALGLGVGCNIVPRAMFRDTFDKLRLIQSNSYMSVVSSGILIGAPLAGGYLVEALGWRSIFMVLGLCSAVIASLVTAFLPETKRRGPERSRAESLVGAYRIVLGDRKFRRHTFLMVSMFLGLVAYDVLGPFIYQNDLRLSPVQYSYTVFLAMGAYLAANLSSKRLAARWGTSKVVSLGLGVGLLGVGPMLLCWTIGAFSVASILIPAALFMMAYGFVFPVAVAEALDSLPHLSGAAASLAGSINMIASVVLSMGLSFLQGNHQSVLSVLLATIIVASGVAWVATGFGARKGG